MSKQRLGKRERMARKRRISLRKQGHVIILCACSVCSKPGEWKFGPAKAKKLGPFTKMVCGQCRSGNKTRAGAQAVGS
jgi:hypothetical protein